MNLQPNMQYIVTKRSNNGTLVVGDKIRLCADGVVMLVNGDGWDGWISPQDIPLVTDGVEVGLDNQWVADRREELERELRLLNEAQCSD